MEGIFYGWTSDLENPRKFDLTSGDLLFLQVLSIGTSFETAVRAARGDKLQKLVGSESVQTDSHSGVFVV